MNIRNARLLEFAGIFVTLPVGMLLLRQRLLLFVLLWAGAAAAYVYLRPHLADIWNRAGFKAGLKPVLKRFLIFGPALAALAYLMTPETFFQFPLQRTGLWLLIMLLYPLLSVWPQEILFRVFIYQRYQPVFGHRTAFIAASALSFAFAHIIFLNPVAVILTGFGGMLFAADYARHKSLALACFEHALYGCALFTVGLGRFFFTGAAWQ